MYLKSIYLKWTYEHFGHKNRVAMLTTFYLTVSGIIIPSVIREDNFKMSKRTKMAICYGRTDGPTLIIEIIVLTHKLALIIKRLRYY